MLNLAGDVKCFYCFTDIQRPQDDVKDRVDHAEFVVATVQGTIGSGTLHQNEIQEQVMGGDADLENIGRILNRVIKCGRDDITIDAGQRHVTEVLKYLDLERAN